MQTLARAMIRRRDLSPLRMNKQHIHKRIKLGLQVMDIDQEKSSKKPLLYSIVKNHAKHDRSTRVCYNERRKNEAVYYGGV
jgi:hypothetical protein